MYLLVSFNIRSVNPRSVFWNVFTSQQSMDVFSHYSTCSWKHNILSTRYVCFVCLYYVFHLCLLRLWVWIFRFCPILNFMSYTTPLSVADSVCLLFFTSDPCNYGLDTTGEKERRTSKKNVDGRSASSQDNKKFRTRSVEKQRGMAFGFRKTATVVKKPDR